MFLLDFPARPARLLADDLEAFPGRGPVHGRIIRELRAPPVDGFVLCRVEDRDLLLLHWWAANRPGAPWRIDLAAALASKVQA